SHRRRGRLRLDRWQRSRHGRRRGGRRCGRPRGREEEITVAPTVAFAPGGANGWPHWPQFDTRFDRANRRRALRGPPSFGSATHHEGIEALSSRLMHAGHRDVAQIRLDNALALFDEFVHNTVKHPDAATLRGLERRFAERLQIQPSYWSQIKGLSRQIGERLARQFEQLCHKPYGWMDQPHDEFTVRDEPTRADDGDATLPQDDDER